MAPKNKIPIIYRSRRILLTCIFVSISFSILSAQKTNEEIFPYDQKEQAPPAKERLFYGGSFGLMFGSVTDIKVSPVVGFWVLPRIAVAAGPTYWFYKDYNLGKTSVYGGRGYMQFVVIQDLRRLIPGSGQTGLFLHAEDELLSLKANYWTPLPANPQGRILINTVLAGGGLSQQIGKRASVNFMVLWPLSEPTNLYELYSKPEIRVSFTF
jgi:hypothetical protein